MMLKIYPKNIQYFLKKVAKTYIRKDMLGKQRCGFIAQDFLDIPLSLGDNLIEK